MPQFANDVFISYSRDDAAWAQKLATQLDRHGIKVFFDQQRITAGDQWEMRLARELQQSRNMVVLWSESARESNWVARELGFFDAVRHQGGQGTPDPDRRLIFINLVGENSAFASVHRIDDLRATVAGGADAEDVPGDLWNRAFQKIHDAIRSSDRTHPIPLAIFAMTAAELRNLDPRSDAGMSMSFEEVVHLLGFDLRGTKGSELAARYGSERGDWRPFGGDQTVDEVLLAILGEINGNVGEPGYRWEPIDMMVRDLDEARRRATAFCAGPAAIVVDPLSLYHAGIARRYLLLQDCTRNEHALVAAFTPVAMPQPMLHLRELIRDLAAPLIDPYYRPPIPRYPHPHFAVNVGDRQDVARLVRSCLGRFAGETQVRASTPYLRPS